MMDVYTFPQQDECLKQLVSASLLPEGDILDTLVLFSHKIGLQQRNAHGVNLGFQLAIHEISHREGATPGLAVMMNMEFDSLMTGLITDNPTFLSEVLKVHNQIMEQVRGS